MKIVRIGLDLAKNVFLVCGVEEQGKVAVRKTFASRPGIGVVCPAAPGGCRNGSLFGSALLGAGAAETRTRCPDHGQPICSPVLAVRRGGEE